MSYYDTIEEDLARAKAILASGKMSEADLDGVPESVRIHVIQHSGTIHITDIFAAYKLLESFVAEIERLRAEKAALEATLEQKWATWDLAEKKAGQ